MSIQCMTSALQTDLKAIMTSFKALFRECQEIEDLYNKSDIQTSISGLGDSGPVTETTKLTKLQFVNGIVMVGEIADMFNNEAVTTGDYTSTCQNIQYGNATATKLSEATEACGDRLYQVALDCLELYKQCKNTEKTYNANEIGDMVLYFDAQRIIWGSDMTANELSGAITLCQKWQAFMGNAAVATADYTTTVAQWERIVS